MLGNAFVEIVYIWIVWKTFGPLMRYIQNYLNFSYETFEKLKRITKILVLVSVILACSSSLLMSNTNRMGIFDEILVCTFHKNCSVLHEPICQRFIFEEVNSCLQPRKIRFVFNVHDKQEWLCTKHSKIHAWQHSLQIITKKCNLCKIPQINYNAVNLTRQ